MTERSSPARRFVDDLGARHWQSIDALGTIELPDRGNFSKLRKGYASIRKSFRTSVFHNKTGANTGTNRLADEVNRLKDECDDERSHTSFLNQIGMNATKLLRKAAPQVRLNTSDMRKGHAESFDAIHSASGSFKVLGANNSSYDSTTLVDMDESYFNTGILRKSQKFKSDADKEVEQRLRRSKRRVLPSANYKAPNSELACKDLDLEQLETIKRDNLRLTLRSLKAGCNRNWPEEAELNRNADQKDPSREDVFPDVDRHLSATICSCKSISSVNHEPVEPAEDCIRKKDENYYCTCTSVSTIESLRCEDIVHSQTTETPVVPEVNCRSTFSTSFLRKAFSQPNVHEQGSQKEESSPLDLACFRVQQVQNQELSLISSRGNVERYLGSGDSSSEQMIVSESDSMNHPAGTSDKNQLTASPFPSATLSISELEKLCGDLTDSFGFKCQDKIIAHAESNLRVYESTNGCAERICDDLETRIRISTEAGESLMNAMDGSETKEGEVEKTMQTSTVPATTSVNAKFTEMGGVGASCYKGKGSSSCCVNEVVSKRAGGKGELPQLQQWPARSEFDAFDGVAKRSELTCGSEQFCATSGEDVDSEPSCSAADWLNCANQQAAELKIGMHNGRQTAGERESNLNQSASRPWTNNLRRSDRDQDLVNFEQTLFDTSKEQQQRDATTLLQPLIASTSCSESEHPSAKDENITSTCEPSDLKFEIKQVDLIKSERVSSQPITGFQDLRQTCNHETAPGEQETSPVTSSNQVRVLNDDDHSEKRRRRQQQRREEIMSSLTGKPDLWSELMSSRIEEFHQGVGTRNSSISAVNRMGANQTTENLYAYVKDSELYVDMHNHPTDLNPMYSTAHGSLKWDRIPMRDTDDHEFIKQISCQTRNNQKSFKYKTSDLKQQGLDDIPNIYSLVDDGPRDLTLKKSHSQLQTEKSKKSLLGKIKSMLTVGETRKHDLKTKQSLDWKAPDETCPGRLVDSINGKTASSWAKKSRTLSSKSTQNLFNGSMRYLSASQKSMNLDTFERDRRDEGAKERLFSSKSFMNGFLTLGRRTEPVALLTSGQLHGKAIKVSSKTKHRSVLGYMFKSQGDGLRRGDLYGSVDSLPSADSGMSCGNLQNSSGDENVYVKNSQLSSKHVGNIYETADKLYEISGQAGAMLLSSSRVRAIGRARAEVDCNPCAYDKEALVFKKGDIIDILERSQSGTWVGRCRGVIGHFKFINVKEITHTNLEDGFGDSNKLKPNHRGYVTRLEIKSPVSSQPVGDTMTKSLSLDSVPHQKATEIADEQSICTNETMMSSLEQLLAAIGLEDEIPSSREDQICSISFRDKSNRDRPMDDSAAEQNHKLSYLKLLNRSGICDLDSFSSINCIKDLEDIGVVKEEHKRRILMAAKIIRQALQAAKVEFKVTKKVHQSGFDCNSDYADDNVVSRGVASANNSNVDSEQKAYSNSSSVVTSTQGRHKKSNSGRTMRHDDDIDKDMHDNEPIYVNLLGEIDWESKAEDHWTERERSIPEKQKEVNVSREQEVELDQLLKNLEVNGKSDGSQASQEKSDRQRRSKVKSGVTSVSRQHIRGLELGSPLANRQGLVQPRLAGAHEKARVVLLPMDNQDRLLHNLVSISRSGVQLDRCPEADNEPATRLPCSHRLVSASDMRDLAANDPRQGALRSMAGASERYSMIGNHRPFTRNCSVRVSSRKPKGFNLRIPNLSNTEQNDLKLGFHDNISDQAGPSGRRAQQQRAFLVQRNPLVSLGYRMKSSVDLKEDFENEYRVTDNHDCSPRASRDGSGYDGLPTGYSGLPSGLQYRASPVATHVGRVSKGQTTRYSNNSQVRTMTTEPGIFNAASAYDIRVNFSKFLET